MLFGYVSDAPMNCSGGSSRLLQPHALNERDKVGRQAMPIRIAPNRTGQPGESGPPVSIFLDQVLTQVWGSYANSVQT
jgi:hypothetical protein